ncbi:hypothetical protein CEP48_08635 [Mergibacter septicus]|uniref:Uncharacterized protein n=1 Tax=Mergibacter septicus TaxID=221402 RepID=A0A8D4J173_9PAST|nr:hypothetical protein [Mergibacter septicus]AWX14226.1 hypothetical protein CEP49_06525 [Mergibacter septicus]AWX16227.1 hypothetical protein CEP47_08630 [Mergibacter septicus]QDJ13686.1 hypothetical protein CEP45_07430 [Mergibacter septicus]QDJ15479.1 hypothetical protein CEP48_08635 [Mergibacter septicus]UTU48651.1 hypothetical protein HLL31_07800 [Mergibacter septicus]
MKEGFTLFEGLTLLLILTLITLLSQPYWYNINQRLVRSIDEKRLLLFLRVIQSQANTQNTDYQLRVSRDLLQGRWCLSAQLSNQPPCNCLQKERCLNQQVSIYFPHSAARTMVVSNNYFPKEHIYFYGKRNTIKAANLSVQAENYQRVLRFADNGRIRLE